MVSRHLVHINESSVSILVENVSGERISKKKGITLWRRSICSSFLLTTCLRKPCALHTNYHTHAPHTRVPRCTPLRPTPHTRTTPCGRGLPLFAFPPHFAAHTALRRLTLGDSYARTKAAYLPEPCALCAPRQALDIRVAQLPYRLCAAASL